MNKIREFVLKYWKLFLERWYVITLTVASFFVIIEVFKPWLLFAVMFGAFISWGFKKVKQ